MSHAKLSPSAAKRWITCPGSIQLSASCPPQPASEAAAQGTVAHGLGERMLRGELNKAQLLALVGTKVEQEGFTITINSEMADGVMFYYDTVMADFREMQAAKGCTGEAKLLIEEKLVAYSVSSELFGTGDAVLYRSGYPVMKVKDLKYGKGHAVEVEDNEQLKIYGLGLLDRFPSFEGDVELQIIQPRAQHHEGPVRTWRISAAALRAYSEELKTAVAATKAKNPRFQSGDHCRYCPANPCSEMSRAVQAAAGTDFEVVPSAAAARLPSVESLTTDRMVAMLRWEDSVEQLFQGIRARLTEELNAGKNIPGVKLVEGKSNRVWKDEEEVKKKIGAVIGQDALYKPRELLGPAGLEKIVGKKTVEPLTTKPAGAKKLVLDMDPRPATGTSAQEDFKSLPAAPAASPTNKGLFPF